MPANEDYETLQQLAERLQLDEKESESFVTSSMKRLGYKPSTQWQEPEPEGGDKGGDGDFFAGRRRQREVQQGGRQQQQQQQQQRASGGSGWQYDD